MDFKTQQNKIMSSVERIKHKFGPDRTINKIQYVSEAYNIREIVELHQQALQSNNGLQKFNHLQSGGDLFFRAIGPVIRLVQFFNIFPTQNVLSEDVGSMTFRWISFLTARSVLYIAWALLEFVLYLKEFTNLSFTLEHFSTSAFFVFNLFGLISLFRVARRWKSIMKSWVNLEEVFLNPPYKEPKYSLKLKIRLVSFVFMLCIFADHVLFTAQMVIYNYMKVKLCDEVKEDFAEYAFMHFKRHIYANFGFNYVLLVVCELLTISLVVSWNFLDLIIILLSIGIVARFAQFMGRLESIKKKNMPATFWTECRLHYNRLQEMVNLVNDNFGMIILLVCSNNIYFLCIKLYSSVKIEFPFVVHQIYFIYSFIVTIGKFVGVLFLAAKINELSMQPVIVVRDIPSESWNSETERFLMQLQNEYVALSGYKLFYITKKFILGITGTIITYEMIVIDNLTVNTGLSDAGIC